MAASQRSLSRGPGLDVIEHLDKVVSVMEETHRVCAPGPIVENSAATFFFCQRLQGSDAPPLLFLVQFPLLHRQESVGLLHWLPIQKGDESSLFLPYPDQQASQSIPGNL